MSSCRSSCTKAFEKSTCLVAQPLCTDRIIINWTVAQDTTGAYSQTNQHHLSGDLHEHRVLPCAYIDDHQDISLSWRPKLLVVYLLPLELTAFTSVFKCHAPVVPVSLVAWLGGILLCIVLLKLHKEWVSQGPWLHLPWGSVEFNMVGDTFSNRPNSWSNRRASRYLFWYSSPWVSNILEYIWV